MQVMRSMRLMRFLRSMRLMRSIILMRLVQLMRLMLSIRLMRSMRYWFWRAVQISSKCVRLRIGQELQKNKKNRLFQRFSRRLPLFSAFDYVYKNISAQIYRHRAIFYQNSVMKYKRWKAVQISSKYVRLRIGQKWQKQAFSTIFPSSAIIFCLRLCIQKYKRPNIKT